MSCNVPLPAARLWGGRPDPAAHHFGARAVGARGPITGPTACPFVSGRCALRGWQEGVARGVIRAVVRGVCG